MKVRHVASFFDFSNVENPEWFRRMCDNLLLQYKFKYVLANNWAGPYKRKKLKKAIAYLRERNDRVLKREFGAGVTYNFKMWRSHDGRERTAILQIMEKV